MALNEADTRAKLIDPALHSRGWTEDSIKREVTAGAIEIVAGIPRQRAAGRADYTLRIKSAPLSTNAFSLCYQLLCVTIRDGLLGQTIDSEREIENEEIFPWLCCANTTCRWLCTCPVRSDNNTIAGTRS